MLPEWACWAAAVLATVRFTWSLMYDDGPFDVLFRIRDRMGAYDYGESPGPDGQPQPKTKAGRFWHCPYCVSMAVALPTAALALLSSPVGDLTLAVFGIAGAAMLAVRWRPWRR